MAIQIIPSTKNIWAVVKNEDGTLWFGLVVAWGLLGERSSLWPFVIETGYPNSGDPIEITGNIYGYFMDYNMARKICKKEI